MRMLPLESSNYPAIAAATTVASDQRRVYSNPSQASPVPPTHGFPTISNQELPQLTPNGPYERPSSLPVSATMPPNAHHHHLPPPLGNYRMNGTVAGAPSYPSHHNAPPHSASLGSTNVEPSAHSIPHTQCPTPVPAPTLQAPVSSAPYQSQAHGMRRGKGPRAQQACEQCRLRRTKCNEGRPSCSQCKENKLTCDYKNTVSSYKPDKTTQLFLNRLKETEERIDEQMTGFQSIQVEQGSNLSRIVDAKEARVFLLKHSISAASQNQVINPMTKPDMPDVLHDQETNEKSISFVVNQDIDAAPGVDKGLKDDDRELSIPVEHITAAHKLLMWPSIKALLPEEYDEDYVMKLENGRGLIWMYGQDEGDGTHEEAWQGQQPSMPNTSSRSTSNWNEGSPPAGSPSGATWRAPGSITPSTPDTSVKMVERGIEESGTFTANPDTVHRLHRSYMDHLHKLHPFLDQKNLEKKIEIFICTYCPTRLLNASILNNGSGSGDYQHGAKRKRSKHRNLPSPVGAIRPDHTFQRRIEQSIDNAVILLVLALGNICEYRDCPVPAPVPRDYCKERNVDVIPGLAYYKYATQILGSLQGGNGLPHVQAALLAGLYAGQLAHPFQSHGWINQAARACQVLVRSRRYEKMNDGPMKDLCDFAYWTCLQLENDILAQIDLPASGISRLEDRIALPKGHFTLDLSNKVEAPSTIMMLFYSAQIYLRKILNWTDSYNLKSMYNTFNVQEILSMNLQQWRSKLPEVMQWKDSDPPSKDINVARLRAKYYEARYIIHRPLLYHALHTFRQPASVVSPTAAPGMTASHFQQVSPSMRHSQQVTSTARLYEGPGPVYPSTTAPVDRWTSYTHKNLPIKLQQACEACISSAIMSTKAFDGIEGRPVVTNIFGTAHAQFGNMLVLSATYMSSLSELVDCNILEQLLERTIRFLWQNKHISPSLRTDALILVDVYVKIFSKPPEGFSSV